MIISASRRTDIPCYYSEWFMNRLKEGFVLTRNPMNHSQVSEVSLLYADVDCIVFWTKDPMCMMDKLDMLDGYNYYFQFTMTPYSRDIERNIRNKQEIMETFIDLSNLIGKNRVLWRYDPIILNDTLDIHWHEEQFTAMCERLHQYTTSVSISFVDNYSKLRTNIIEEISLGEMKLLAAKCAEIAGQYGLAVKACCEDVDLSECGIEPASCIDKRLIEELCGYQLAVKPDKNQRKGCGCCISKDIGVYNTCENGCVYCYANYSTASVERNVLKHKTDGRFLI